MANTRATTVGKPLPPTEHTADRCVQPKTLVNIMALFRVLIIFIVSISPTLSFGQSTNYRYDFFIKQILSLRPEGTIIVKNGSSKTYELFIDKKNGFDPSSCMFIDNKYYSKSFWDTIFIAKDAEFLYEQINRYRKFRWDAKNLPEHIILYSKAKAKRYSKKAFRFFNRESNKDFTYRSINYFSLPLFNSNKNFAIIYCGEYSGPESSSVKAAIFLKIDGKWVRIGTYMHSMS